MEFWITHNEIDWSGAFPRGDQEALLASIAKWKAIVDWHTDPLNYMPTNVGWPSCALCRIHLHENACYRCPVYDWSGYQYCHNTPFDEYLEQPNIKNAQDELAFLKKLYAAQNRSQDPV